MPLLPENSAHFLLRIYRVTEERSFLSNGGANTAQSTDSTVTCDGCSTEKAKEEKAGGREAAKARGKTRVNIGVAFQRWRQLRDLKGLSVGQVIICFASGTICYFHEICII